MTSYTARWRYHGAGCTGTARDRASGPRPCARSGRSGGRARSDPAAAASARPRRARCRPPRCVDPAPAADQIEQRELLGGRCRARRRRRRRRAAGTPRAATQRERDAAPHQPPGRRAYVSATIFAIAASDSASGRRCGPRFDGGSNSHATRAVSRAGRRRLREPEPKQRAGAVGELGRRDLRAQRGAVLACSGVRSSQSNAHGASILVT